MGLQAIQSAGFRAGRTRTFVRIWWAIGIIAVVGVVLFGAIGLYGLAWAWTAFWVLFAIATCAVYWMGGDSDSYESQLAIDGDDGIALEVTDPTHVINESHHGEPQH